MGKKDYSSEFECGCWCQSERPCSDFYCWISFVFNALPVEKQKITDIWAVAFGQRFLHILSIFLQTPDETPKFFVILCWETLFWTVSHAVFHRVVKPSGPPSLLVKDSIFFIFYYPITDLLQFKPHTTCF